MILHFIFVLFQIKLIVLIGIKMILRITPASQTLFRPMLSEHFQQEQGIERINLIKINLKGHTRWG